MNDGTDILWTMIMFGVAFAAVIATFTVLPVAVLIMSPVLGFMWWYQRPSQREQRAQTKTLALYEGTLARIGPGLAPNEIDQALSSTWPTDVPQETKSALLRICRELYATFSVGSELPAKPITFNSVEGARFRDQLHKIAASTQTAASREVALTISKAMLPLLHDLPKNEGDLSVPAAHLIREPNVTVHDMVATFFGADGSYFKPMLDVFNRNMEKQKFVQPSEYEKDDVVEVYLKGTPLLQLFQVPVPIGIRSRPFEHTFMLGATGHGKTQAMEYFIAKLLPEVAAGRRSVVVIDSQRELIQTILETDFPRDRVVYINPEDLTHPFHLNLFSMSGDREYGQVQSEQLRNSVISLLEFVLASIMDAELSSQQAAMFRYSISLVLEVPNATINTFLNLMEQPKGFANYREHVKKLDRVAQSFFENQFDDPEYMRMRKAVLRRLYIIMGNRSFMRMFDHPVSKFDMFDELNEGKLILVNTSLATLREEASRTFGRFFLALIAQAAEERAMISHHQRTPTEVFIDEAQEYLDENVDRLLAQARKQKIGIFMATQYASQQRMQRLRGAIAANTNTKFAGGVSSADAKSLAADMRTDADFIQNQPVLSFAAYVKGVTDHALPIKFPVGSVSNLPKRSDMDDLIELQHENYSGPEESKEDPEEELPKTPDEGEDEPPRFYRRPLSSSQATLSSMFMFA